MLRNLFFAAVGFVIAVLVLGDDPATTQAIPNTQAGESLPNPKPPAQALQQPTMSARATPSAVETQDSLVEPEKAKVLFQGTRYVTGTRVNFRSGPSIRDDVLGSLVQGAKVATGPKQGGWTRIRLPDGREGWMASRYLGDAAPKAATTRTRAVAAPSAGEITRARREIIRQSIAAYPGSCPCPYNRDRAGRRCGGRSAWSRPGGRSPICYESDVSEARLSTYFARRSPDR